MPEDYKLKDYTKKNYSSGGRPRGPWKIIGILVGLVVLVFVGISAYKPVSNFITGRTKATLPPPPAVEPAPEEEPTPPPEIEQVENHTETGFKGAVLPYGVAKDPNALKGFMDQLPKEINMLYLEAKNPQGEILFQTTNQQAQEWGGVVDKPVSIPDLVKTLTESGLSLGVKLSVFSDPVAARGALPSAIMHSSGVLWIDNTLDKGGKPWLSPYGGTGVAYNLSLIEELAQQGVALIVLEQVQLPNDPTNSAVLGETEGVPLFDSLAHFVELATKAGGQVPVYLLLTENQVVDKAEGRNPQNFGGDPRNLPALGWVVQVEGKLDGAVKDELEPFSQEENILLLATEETQDVPVKTERYIVAWAPESTKK